MARDGPFARPIPQPPMTPTTPHKIPARAWGIVALVSLALLLFILDRQVLAVLKTTLKARMGWTDLDYSWLVTGFSVAYTVGALFAGRFIDRFGTRLTASLSIGVMSIAAILCGTATNFSEMLAARIVLGFADAGVTIAAVVAVARWFPAERRATAISFKTPFGLMGFVIAPPLVALITAHHDWHYAFFIPGAFGLLVPAVWWWLDKNPPDYGVPPAPKRSVSWRELFRFRALWGILIARVVAEPVYVFYINWQPGVPSRGHGHVARRRRPLRVDSAGGEFGVGDLWRAGVGPARAARVFSDTQPDHGDAGLRAARGGAVAVALFAQLGAGDRRVRHHPHDLYPVEQSGRGAHR